MSRHRNVRSMNYSEECEEFDDVYGHSVEDDHCISPSEARFLYDRTRHPQMSAFINEENIAEEEEPNVISDGERKGFDKSQQSRIDEEKLRLCVDDIQNVIGDIVPQSTIEEVVLKYNYDVPKALDHILNANETLGNALVEEPLPQRENKIRNKDRDDDTKASAIPETSGMSGLFSGGGDGPGNRVRKFVIPKLKCVQVERLEKGVENLTIEGDFLNNFSSLKSLMEHHQKSAVADQEEKKCGERSPAEKSPSTLAEFSKSFLNQKNPTDIPSLPADEKKSSFVIPKLHRKPVKNPESKWLIDLSSALKSASEPRGGPGGPEAPQQDADPLVIPQAPREIFLESNFDASKILSSNLELGNENSSPFGRILCGKWKPGQVTLVERENFLGSRVVHFDFSTPSPDDMVLKYIRRK